MSIDVEGLEGDQGKLQVGVLTVALDAHPERLSVEELNARMSLRDLPTEQEAAATARAIEVLKGSGLLHEEDGLLAATEAALHFDYLPF